MLRSPGLQHAAQLWVPWRETAALQSPCTGGDVELNDKEILSTEKTQRARRRCGTCLASQLLQNMYDPDESGREWRSGEQVMQNSDCSFLPAWLSKAQT